MVQEAARNVALLSGRGLARIILGVHLGKVKAGTYMLELYDVDHKEAILLRRCKVAEK